MADVKQQADGKKIVSWYAKDGSAPYLGPRGNITSLRHDAPGFKGLDMRLTGASIRVRFEHQGKLESWVVPVGSLRSYEDGE